MLILRLQTICFSPRIICIRIPLCDVGTHTVIITITTQQKICNRSVWSLNMDLARSLTSQHISSVSPFFDGVPIKPAVSKCKIQNFMYKTMMYMYTLYDVHTAGSLAPLVSCFLAHLAILVCLRVIRSYKHKLRQ